MHVAIIYLQCSHTCVLYSVFIYSISVELWIGKNKESRSKHIHKIASVHCIG